MAKVPVRRAPRVPRKADDARELAALPERGTGFFSFRYSFTEISADGERAHVKSRRARFEDGRLTTESFDGELDRGAYEQMARAAAQLAAAQIEWLLQGPAALLALFGGRRSKG